MITYRSSTVIGPKEKVTVLSPIAEVKRSVEGES